MKIGVIIPARSSSARFPRKHLAKLGEKTVIGVLIERACQIGADEVIVATTALDEDRDLVVESIANGAVVFRGHPVDLLERYLDTYRAYELTHALDISGDCPFFRLDMARGLIAAIRESPDYGSFAYENSFVAFDDRGVSGKALYYYLEYAKRIAEVPMQRREQYWTALKDPPVISELVLPYPGDRTRTPIKLSVDWPFDLAVLNLILDKLGRYPETQEDIEGVWAKVHRLKEAE